MELRNLPLQVQNERAKRRSRKLFYSRGSHCFQCCDWVSNAVIGYWVRFSPGLWGKGCMRVPLGQLACPTERVEQGTHSLKLGLHSVKDT